MSILKSKDNKELIISCSCCCDSGIHIRIDKDDYDYYALCSYTNGKFYGEQGEKAWRIWQKKLKKIWAILRNKDFYYAEVVMTKDDFEEFKEYVVSI